MPTASGTVFASTWDIPRTTQNGAPFGELHGTQTMEQYSIALVHAIATRARCKVERLLVDDEQVDVTIRQKGSKRLYSRVMVDVQLKCTTQDVVHADGLHFRIKRDQYDGLRERGIVKKILVAVGVDPDFDEWMTSSPDDLLLKGCAYWMPVDGLPPITTQSTTLVLPDANRFNAEQLLDLLHRIATGGTP